MVDIQKKALMHLNSIKYNSKYKTNAKKWQKVFGLMFHIYYDNEEMKNWSMLENAECPSQPVGSLDYGLYCLKYIEFLARRDKPNSWDFIDKDISVYWHQLATRLLRESLNQKIDSAAKI